MFKFGYDKEYDVKVIFLSACSNWQFAPCQVAQEDT